MPIPQYRVEVDAVGVPTVYLNGEKVEAHVTAVAFQAAPGNYPVLTLRLAHGEPVIEGEGIVQIQSGDNDQISDSEVIQAFLDSFEPAMLVKAAMEGVDMGGPDPITAALGVLKEWARDY